VVQAGNLGVKTLLQKNSHSFILSTGKFSSIILLKHYCKRILTHSFWAAEKFSSILGANLGWQCNMLLHLRCWTFWKLTMYLHIMIEFVADKGKYWISFRCWIFWMFIMHHHNFAANNKEKKKKWKFNSRYWIFGNLTVHHHHRKS